MRLNPLFEHLTRLALQCTGYDRLVRWVGFAHVIAGLCLQIYCSDPSLMVPLL